MNERDDDDELTIHMSRDAARLLFSCMRRHNIDLELEEALDARVPADMRRISAAQGADDVYEFLRRAALETDE